MSKDTPSYIWQSQECVKNCETIKCPDYDPYKNFQRDSTGFYVLVKVDFSTIRMEVAICNKDHKIVKIFSGKKSQDIYDTIFKYEKKHNLQWFKNKTHIAYLGKELKKAELALVLGNNAYFQE